MRFVRTCLLITFLWSSLSTYAGTPPDDDSTLVTEKAIEAYIDSIESTLHYVTGKVSLANGTATIEVPKHFKFLNAEEAEYVVTELWGNPKGEKPLGLLIPANSSVLNAGSYAFVVQYEGMGYVKDGDADDINYDDLLKELKESSAKENIERKKLGLSTMDLVGWASSPYYDASKKVLYWAKEYKVEDETENTLNYDVRILGRKGVLILQAVATMDQLDSVNAHKDEVFNMISFADGNKYADFDSNTDEVAAWTIGGLVAGKVLAKVGFFAVILKFGKFIIGGIVLLGGIIWRFIRGRKKEEEYVYQPETTSRPNSLDEPTA